MPKFSCGSRPFLLFLLTLCMTACVEVEPPSDADISCETTDECPNGWECRETGTEGDKKCKQVAGEDADNEAPALNGGVLIEPLVGKEGTVFTVCFSANEILNDVPTVSLDGSLGVILLSVAETAPESCSDHEYVFQWTAKPTDATPGTHPLTVDLVDANLNKAEQISLGTITLDFSPPTLSGGVELVSSPARENSTVNVSFSFNEPVSNVQVTMVTEGIGPQPWIAAEEVTQGFGFTFQYPVSAEDTQGEWAVMVDATDLAGNASGTLELDDLILDFAPPSVTLSEAIIDSPAGPGDFVTAQFPSENVGDFALYPSLNALSDAGNLAFSPAVVSEGQLIFTYVPLPENCGGTTRTYDLNLSGGSDLAGNEMDEVNLPDALVVDCEAPNLTDVCLYPPGGSVEEACPDPTVPRFYRNGDVAVLTASMSEPANGIALFGSDELADCASDGQENCCTFTPEAMTFSCSKTVDDDVIDGFVQWTVELRDTIGNTRLMKVDPVFQVDASAPRLVSHSISPNPANATDEVVVSLTFSEAVENVTLSAGDLPFVRDGNDGLNQSAIFKLPAAASDLTDEYTLSVSATDEAGNVLTDEALDTPLQLDTQLPDPVSTCIYPVGTTVGDSCPGEEVLRRYKQGDEMVIQIVLNEAGTALVYLSNSQLSDDGACIQDDLTITCTRVISEEEGNWEITATVFDSYQNQKDLFLGTAAYDGVPPEATAFFSEGPFGIDDTIFITVSVTEPIAEQGGVVGSTGNLPFGPQNGTINDSRTQAAWEFSVSGENTTIQSGGYKGEIVFQDPFGNQSEPVTVGDIYIDTDEPDLTISDASTIATYSAQEPHNQVTVSFEVADAECYENLKTEDDLNCAEAIATPSATLNGLGLTCSTEPPWSCSGLINEEAAAILADGPGTIVVTVTDSAGNDVQANKPVQLDFTGPLVTSSQVTYLPGLDNPLPLVSAATEGTQVNISFTTNEEVTVDAIGASCTLQPLIPLPIDNSETFFTYYWLVTTELDGIDCEVNATLTDSWGNTANPVINHDSEGELLPQSTIRIDRTAPVASNALDLSGVKHVRMPYGAAQSNYEAAQYVAARDADNLEPLDETATLPENIVLDPDVQLIQFYDAEVGGILQGQTQDYTRALKLNQVDAPALYAEVVDSAGNVSEDRVKMISEYVGTFATDDSAPNPNPLQFVASNTGTSIRPNNSDERLGSSFRVNLQSASLDQPEPSVADMGLLSWRPLEEAVSSPNYPIQIYDSKRNVAIFMDSVEGSTYEFDGEHWKRVSLVDPELDSVPIGIIDGAFVYDSNRGVILYFGGQTTSGIFSPFCDSEASTSSYYDTCSLNILWEYDGVSWKKITFSDPEGDGNPPGRTRHSMVYDSARERTILLGGQAGVNTGEPCGNGLNANNNHLCYRTFIWEYNGISWTKIIAADPEGDGYPGSLDYSAMVYDTARGVTVLFGGQYQGPGNQKNDTWEYDGLSWRKINPTDPEGDGNPSARSQHSLTYDAVRGVTVLHGGEDRSQECSDGASQFCDDTWEYDGLSWRKINPTDPEGDGHPEARFGHTLTYDTARGLLVLSGGEDDSGVLTTDVLWEYNGISWRQKALNTSGGTLLPARYGAAMTHDTVRSKSVLFGGSPYDVAESSGTWEFDGSTWSEATLEDPEGDGRPSGRTWSSMTFDSARGVSVLFGGDDDNQSCTPHVGRNCGDTWEYDGMSWQKIIPADPEGDGNPGPRHEMNLVYDTDRSVTILFGGYQGSNDTCNASIPDPKNWYRCNDTWEYDGNSWKKIVTTDPEGDGDPNQRQGVALAYDPHRHVTVLFGGQTGFWDDCTPNESEYCGDTWEYNGTSWKKVLVADPEGDGNPTAVYGASLSYVPTTKTMLLVGGHAYETRFPDSVWEYDGVSWKRRILSTIEGASFFTEDRYWSGSTFDPLNQMVLVQGGQYGETCILNNDLCGTNYELTVQSGTFALPVVQVDISPASLLAVTALAITARPQPAVLNTFSWTTSEVTQSKAHQFSRESFGQFDVVQHTVTDPIQLRRLGKGHDSTLTAAFEQVLVGPEATGGPIELDYMELRILYDLEADNSQVEASCGDGVLHPSLGEVCDDGNTEDSDYCSPDCKEELGSCGDGIIQGSAGEECDGHTDTHWCSSNCWYRIAKEGSVTDGGIADGGTADAGLVDGGTDGGS